MRLIDAESLKDRLSEYTLSKDEYKRFCKIVDAESTAYDVGEVIREIEQLRVQYFITTANTGVKALDVAYEKVYQALDKAIEIVKEGGNYDK